MSLLLTWSAACSNAPVTPTPGEPRAEITTLAGAPLEFEALLGAQRQTVVAFMTAWCEVCRREQPQLETWARVHRAATRTLLVISGSSLPEARALVEARQLDSQALTIVIDADGRLANRLKVEATPTFMVFAAGGERVGTHHRLDAVPRPRSSFLKRAHDHGNELGTTYDAVVLTSRDRLGAADRDLLAARRRCQQLALRLSEWRKDSEVSAVNAGAADGPVSVSDDLRQILAGAQHVSKVTRGAFDVTWRPLGRAWDAAAKRGEAPDGEALAAVRAAVGYQRLRLDQGGVQFGHPDMELGIAGVAKGWIIDAVFHHLHQAGYQHILVNIGGDLRTSGRDLDGTPRKLALVDPYKGGKHVVAEIETTDTAVATSGNYLRGRDVGGTRIGHILDPRTGAPPAFDGSVTVLAQDAAMADALATALFVMGPDAGLNWVAKAKGVEAIYLTRDGIRASEGIRIRGQAPF